MTDFSRILNFLVDLQLNNDRPWFNKHKDEYLDAKNEFDSFINQMIPEVKSFDSFVDVDTAKDCVFRIYRDSRFSNDKSPYKTNFGGVIAKGGRKSIYGGYYIHIDPNQSFIGGGIYRPQANELKAIRYHIYNHPNVFKEIINDATFKSLFGNIQGDKLKLAPKGFPKDFEEVDLLKHKSFAVIHQGSFRFLA